MRNLPFSVLTLGLILACNAETATETARSPEGPSLVKNGQDLTGLPDLIVDSKATQNNWVTRVEDFPAEFCSVVEGDVNPGTHKVIRFTVTTPNVGNADVFVGNPRDHIAANDGLFELATCHAHYHFQHYAEYRPLHPVTRSLRQSAN